MVERGRYARLKFDVSEFEVWDGNIGTFGPFAAAIMLYSFEYDRQNVLMFS